MLVSPKKRAANRRNALKSTGPKSGPGRRVSAQNATRHGLSVPLPQHLIDPLQAELAQLITSDGIPLETARDLAQKIIDYERNMAYLRIELIIEVFETQAEDEEEGSVNFLRGIDEVVNSRRYFKRSSNQLIKALRQL